MLVTTSTEDEMDTLEAIGALERVMDEPVLLARRIGDGEGAWTFEVNGRYVARFPRDSDVARRVEAEMALLPRLATLVDVAVPSIRWRGVARGFPFFVYDAIPGHSLTAADLGAHPTLAHALAGALRQLHRIGPVQLGTAGTGAAGEGTSFPSGALDAWRARYARLRETSEVSVFPLLDAGVSSRLDAAWDEFGASLSFTTCFVHGDLGAAHLLVDDGRVAGIIDWESAGPGDPAVDFVGIAIELGPTGTREILDLYGTEDRSFNARVLHYVWLGALEAIVHAKREGLADLVVEACVSLGDRLWALDRCDGS